MPEITTEKFLTEWLEDNLKYATYIEPYAHYLAVWIITYKVGKTKTTEEWEFDLPEDDNPDQTVYLFINWDNGKSGEKYEIDMAMCRKFMDMIYRKYAHLP